ncbi:MAG TPA: hypothetical protein PK079_14155 [Leptospiraceae bacterium]|nr:hypothetical protein [Leptospiraceae bacterium]HMW04160.1 hypothetical protein [Leptospiraceae bacterium]HMX34663.1 hypothetical protein [Leptospiraceae bacterium]HMY30153.1 hypothetical protein [Leptospiraceae bacterium]HMZ67222.1 hypothetical protein [Leptospiraceae bacterium]
MFLRALRGENLAFIKSSDKQKSLSETLRLAISLSLGTATQTHLFIDLLEKGKIKISFAIRIQCLSFV